MKLKKIKNNFIKVSGLLSLMLALVLLISNSAWAWPTDSQWLPLYQGEAYIQDAINDTGGSDSPVNIVPIDGVHPAAYVYNDGSYLYYRLRIDDDPTGGGSGIFNQFGWGFEIDMDQNADDYEWLIMCDGISQPEVISLRENTDKTGVGDPSDKAEYVAAEYPLVGNHRLIVADTTTHTKQDYFLDFRLPYAVFKAETGITDDTLIRYFAGSSRSTNNLTDNGADLVAGAITSNATLSDMGTNYITPSGNPPPNGSTTDGSVRFVDSLDGFNDAYLASGGDTIYVRVDDADQTLTVNPTQTISVELTAPSGDSITVILTATGVSGKFTGSVTTEEVGRANQIDDTDSILQVRPSATAPNDQEIITVTYVDSIEASGNQQVDRTDTITFTTTATDLSVRKSVDTSGAQLNDTVSFTIVVNNLGPNNATGIVVSDLLPAGLSYVSSSVSTGSYNSGTGVWTGFDLTAGSSATLTVDAQVTVSSGSITNTAMISALNQPDGYTGNDSASATLYVGGTDIRITKTVDNDYPAENDLIVFTVRALNLGPNDATTVVVNDLLPADLTYDSATGYTATQGTYDNTTGLWTVGDLGNGIGAVLTVPARPAAGTEEKILTNTASLSSLSEPETNTTNDSASVDIKVGFYDLELTKQVGVGPSYNPLVDVAAPNQNGAIRYVITVTNNGPNDATGIEVTDSLPNGVSYVSVQSVSQGNYNSTSGIWTVGDVDNGDTATLRINATIDGGTAGQTIINTAEITTAINLDDDSSNNSDTAAIKVDGTDLMISKTVSDPIPSAGDSITYTLTVTNNGPNAATNVAVTDILPTGVSYDTHSPAGASYDTGNNSTGVWDIGSLSVAASTTLIITADVDSDTSGQTINNVAMITESDQEDQNSLNNVASATISVDGTDLEVIKSVDDTTPNESQDITYTIIVTNNGPTDATGIEVKDILPPEVTYQSSTVPAGDTYNSTTGIWTIGALPATAGSNTAQLDIVAQVKSNTSGLIITNNASINAVDQGDQNPANDLSSIDVAVAGTDLSLSKTIDNATPGILGAVTYTITVTNSGTNGATGIEVEDILPAGITYISDTPNQGSYSTGTWLVGSLSAGTSATLKIMVGVDGPLGTTVTNTASIVGFDQTDDNPANDSVSVDFIPVAWPVLTVVKSATTLSDPAHGTVNPYDIPGAIIEYNITVANTGLGATDADSILLVDPIPANTALVVTDPPVMISNVTAITGLTMNFVALDNPTDHVEFSSDGSDYSLSPSPDGNGTDTSVKYLRFSPTGQFKASDGTTDPSFTVTFKVRLQ